MTRRERVIAALSHREVFPVPYEIGFTQEEYRKVADYLGDEQFFEKIGGHVEMVTYDSLGWETVRPGFVRDHFGVVWNRSGPDKDIGIIEKPIITEPDVSLIKMPTILKDEYSAAIKAGNKGDRFFTAALGFSLFERAWTLRSMEELLVDMVLHPNFAHALFDAICDYNLQVIDIGLSFDIDAYYFGDDWGQQKGLIMGPKHYREFIKPRLAKMYDKVRRAGKFVIQHSCGDISEIFPDVIDIGLSCYNTFQPEIYDIAACKAEFGKDLAFFGALSTQRMLPFETPAGVREKTVEIIKTLMPGGGYIAAPTHAVPYDVPAENIEALIDVLQNQEKYIDV